MKRLPWISLTLLMLAHSIFGWLLAVWSLSWLVWLGAAIVILLITVSVTEPSKFLKICFGNSLKSDSKSFVLVLGVAFSAVVILRWLPIFAHFFVLISASLLARLDLQTSGFRKAQDFWILAIASLASYALGLSLHRLLIIHQIL